MPRPVTPRLTSESIYLHKVYLHDFTSPFLFGASVFPFSCGLPFFGGAVTSAAPWRDNALGGMTSTYFENCCHSSNGRGISTLIIFTPNSAASLGSLGAYDPCSSKAVRSAASRVPRACTFTWKTFLFRLPAGTVIPVGKNFISPAEFPSCKKRSLP